MPCWSDYLHGIVLFASQALPLQPVPNHLPRNSTMPMSVAVLYQYLAYLFHSAIILSSDIGLGGYGDLMARETQPLNKGAND